MTENASQTVGIHSFFVCFTALVNDLFFVVGGGGQVREREEEISALMQRVRDAEGRSRRITEDKQEQLRYACARRYGTWTLKGQRAKSVVLAASAEKLPHVAYSGRPCGTWTLKGQKAKAVVPAASVDELPRIRTAYSGRPCAGC